MTRTLHHAAFAAGLLALVWVGAGYLPGHPLALALVLLIGAFFLMGALELQRFQQSTAGLTQLLAATDAAPVALGPWLAQLHPSLQNAVRLRVEGERVALPGPALTPTLCGLLVLLGMLGSFLGMVATLQGTGVALQSATDVQAIRASLAAPIQGLGLAFGTSVAGVAASAMLGLMSALARRERLAAAQQLDAHIATTLRGLSRAQQREQVQDESLRLLRTQADVLSDTLPALVRQLQALSTQMTLQARAQHDDLSARQARFHDETQRVYTALAASVDRSLQTSLTESARLAGDTIAPVVRATMEGLSRETAALRDAVGAAVQQQLDGVGLRLDSMGQTLAERWQAALAEQQRAGAAMSSSLHTGLDRYAQAFEQRSAALLDAVATRMDHSATLSAEAWARAQAAQGQGHEALLRSVAEAHAALEAGAGAREQERLRSVHDSLTTMTTALQQQAQQHGDAMAARQQQICAALERSAMSITAQAEAQARATLAEITQLVQVASQAPRAAAELIGALRQALSDSLVRDNAALDERNRLLGTLAGLLDAVNDASGSQRAAIDALLRDTTEMLDRVGTRFAETVATESRTLQGVAAQVTGSAAEVASLGEGFAVAVRLFSQASEQMTSQLQRIESALGQSMARSDEQLAYYVAQAREIVDLTLGAQKQIVDDLQRLALANAEAA